MPEHSSEGTGCHNYRTGRAGCACLSFPPSHSFGRFHLEKIQSCRERARFVAAAAVAARNLRLLRAARDSLAAAIEISWSCQVSGCLPRDDHGLRGDLCAGAGGRTGSSASSRGQEQATGGQHVWDLGAREDSGFCRRSSSRHAEPARIFRKAFRRGRKHGLGGERPNRRLAVAGHAGWRDRCAALLSAAWRGSAGPLARELAFRNRLEEIRSPGLCRGSAGGLQAIRTIFTIS